MLKLALVGKEISHSLSQKMYEDLLKQKVDYSLLDYSSNQLIPPLSVLFGNVWRVSGSLLFQGVDLSIS